MICKISIHKGSALVNKKDTSVTSRCEEISDAGLIFWDGFFDDDSIETMSKCSFICIGPQDSLITEKHRKDASQLVFEHHRSKTTEKIVVTPVLVDTHLVRKIVLVSIYAAFKSINMSNIYDGVTRFVRFALIYILFFQLSTPYSVCCVSVHLKQKKNSMPRRQDGGK